jgi:hypothetical protein
MPATVGDGSCDENLKPAPTVQDDKITSNKGSGAATTQARLKAEEAARLKAEEEAMLKVLEQDAPLNAEEEARLKADQETRRKAWESKLGAKEKARLKDEEEARLKVKSKIAEPRGPALVNHSAERSHALTDGGHDNKNLKPPPPAVQDDETSKKRRGAAKGNKSESAEPARGPPLLSSAERKIISHALADGPHDDNVIVQVGSSGSHKVTRQAMQSLKPGQWLEDEVVNTFLYLLSHREEELSRNNVTRKRNGFFNSFFMTKLLNEGHSKHSGEYEYNNIRNWSTKFVPGGDIFEVDKLFFVINVERTHWVLAVADMLNQKIQMYDSGSSRYAYQSIGKNGIRCLQNLFRYLQDEHMDKKKTPLRNANCWQLIPCQSDTPQQQNGKFQQSVQRNVYIFLFSSYIMVFMEGYDCGVYACMFADRLSKDGLSSCSPEDATRNRERLVLSLIQRSPLLEYAGVVLRREQQTQIEGVRQQNELNTLDSKEGSNSNVKMASAYKVGLENNKTPAVISCSRSTIPALFGSSIEKGAKGGYLAVKTKEEAALTLVSSGSEVGFCVEAAKKLTADGITPTRVVSMPHKEGQTGKKDWTKLRVSELKAELRVCNLKMSGRKADLVSRLISSDLGIHKLENRINAKLTSQLTSLELLELQKLEEHLHEIDKCILNLKEYCGHLARHVSEDTYAQSKIDNLADDVVIVTLDYKMKILSCFFRETQKKWFGKEGTNLLGFMITTNSLVEADNLRGVKDVQFIFMVTDDSLTDAWEVACAKTAVYEEFLPDHVKKVRFWSDGAGCFKSKTHRVFQPFWKHWTGVDEIELQITPAGNGKSQL